MWIIITFCRSLLPRQQLSYPHTHTYLWWHFEEEKRKKLNRSRCFHFFWFLCSSNRNMEEKKRVISLMSKKLHIFFRFYCSSLLFYSKTERFSLNSCRICLCGEREVFDRAHKNAVPEENDEMKKKLFQIICFDRFSIFFSLSKSPMLNHYQEALIISGHELGIQKPEKRAKKLKYLRTQSAVLATRRKTDMWKMNYKNSIVFRSTFLRERAVRNRCMQAYVLHLSRIPGENIFKWFYYFKNW